MTTPDRPPSPSKGLDALRAATVVAVLRAPTAEAGPPADDHGAGDATRGQLAACPHRGS